LLHLHIAADCTFIRNITLKELEALIDEMAIKYKDDKKTDVDAAKEQLREKMAAAKSKLHGTTVSTSLCVFKA